MTSIRTTAADPSRRRRFPAFAYIVVGLLAAHAVGMGFAIYVATRPSPGGVVEPQYYERAVNWDRDRGGTK